MKFIENIISGNNIDFHRKILAKVIKCPVCNELSDYGDLIVNFHNNAQKASVLGKSLSDVCSYMGNGFVRTGNNTDLVTALHGRNHFTSGGTLFFGCPKCTESGYEYAYEYHRKLLTFCANKWSNGKNLADFDIVVFGPRAVGKTTFLFSLVYASGFYLTCSEAKNENGKSDNDIFQTDYDSYKEFMDGDGSYNQKATAAASYANGKLSQGRPLLAIDPSPSRNVLLSCIDRAGEDYFGSGIAQEEIESSLGVTKSPKLLILMIDVDGIYEGKRSITAILNRLNHIGIGADHIFNKIAVVFTKRDKFNYSNSDERIETEIKNVTRLKKQLNNVAKKNTDNNLARFADKIAEVDKIVWQILSNKAKSHRFFFASLVGDDDFEYALEASGKNILKRKNKQSSSPSGVYEVIEWLSK